MYRLYLAAVDMLPGVLMLAPAYWILNRAYYHNTRKSFFYFVFSCYLSVVYVLVGMPNVTESDSYYWHDRGLEEQYSECTPFYSVGSVASHPLEQIQKGKTYGTVRFGYIFDH